MLTVCPYPLTWNRIYCKLKKKWIEDGCSGEHPPKPLIVDLWASSSDQEKSERWCETLEWAKKNHYSLLQELYNQPMYGGFDTSDSLTDFSSSASTNQPDMSVRTSTRRLQ
ncbi:hypothetical protein [Marinibactrum halimedae]|uniref:hypothetical protein n=1 Tax=Marinibactrum halimedae TaxID=1444977 RepID=UPI001E2A2093|nr:hypothetical protein [Marinibactrum halimedae]MCD9459052.1 hypothetical protein [Marinibactrum halimedae]